MNIDEQQIIIGKPYLESAFNRTYLCSKIVWHDIEETVWFSVEEEYGEYLTCDRADAFVTAFLMAAMHGGVSIVCRAPITRRLRYQLNHYLIPVMAANLEGLCSIRLCAEATDHVLPCAGAIGTEYSEDITGTYSIKKYLNVKEMDYRLTHLLVANNGALGEYGDLGVLMKRVNDIKKNIAPEWKLNVIGVDTNLHKVQAESYSSVSSLRRVSVVLALQKLFGVFLNPAMYQFSQFSFDENDCSHYDLATLGLLETDNTVFYSVVGAYSQKHNIKVL